MSSTTTTSSGSGKRKIRRQLALNSDEQGKRRNTLMGRVNKAKTLGKKIPVQFDDKGQPIGKEGDELSSYFGVLAREHVPLSMRDWRCKDNAQIKERIWNEMQEGFTIPIEQKHDCLMRVGEAARLFRHEIYNDLLKDIINEPIALKRPACILKYYTSITEEDWIAFVEYRRTEMFKQTSEHGKSNIGKSVYKSRTGRNGYRKLDQEKVRFIYFF